MASQAPAPIDAHAMQLGVGEVRQRTLKATCAVGDQTVDGGVGGGGGGCAGGGGARTALESRWGSTVAA